MQALELKSSAVSYNNATTYQKLVADRTLTSTLPNVLRATRKDILSTVILPFDGSVFLAAKNSSSSPVPDYPFHQQWWYQEAIKADGDVVFINPHAQDYLLDLISSQVFSVARLIKDPDSQRPLAVIMADEDNVVLGDIVSTVHLNVSSISAIFGTNDKLLYSNQPLSSRVADAIIHQESAVQDENHAYLPVISPAGLAHSGRQTDR